MVSPISFSIYVRVITFDIIIYFFQYCVVYGAFFVTRTENTQMPTAYLVICVLMPLYATRLRYVLVFVRNLFVFFALTSWGKYFCLDCALSLLCPHAVAL